MQLAAGSDGHTRSRTVAGTGAAGQWEAAAADHSTKPWTRWRQPSCPWPRVAAMRRLSLFAMPGTAELQSAGNTAGQLSAAGIVGSAGIAAAGPSGQFGHRLSRTSDRTGT